MSAVEIVAGLAAWVVLALPAAMAIGRFLRGNA